MRSFTYSGSRLDGLPVYDDVALHNCDDRGDTECPQADGRDVGNAEPGQACRDQDRQESFGSLGDPDVAGEAEAFRPRLGVGDDGATDQAAESQPGEYRLVTPRGVPPDKAAEDRTITDAVEGRVQPGSPRTAGASGPRDEAVDEV